ncbi:SLAC1 anion channel family protein [Azospirillum thermophilum]|uniref:C4-dicarboxylate ABC transporter n=1 Tax=Azospirillum thermophilum TaxID=2202148 RepID=A0A2S2CKR6_9PROT|nr:SLAC1 anion channel family protein [Azospirillum thermophilum]AWK84960.1 C4-dicarboxylate ABC transporter [Azospirillum thermophilum]
MADVRVAGSPEPAAAAARPVSDHGAEPFSRLGEFPVSFFSAVMGLSGLTAATQRMEAAHGLPAGAGTALFALTAAVFLLLSATYLCKVIRHPEAVRAEWSHPVRICFFPTISISAILLATAAQGVDAGLSFGLWAAGAAAHLVLTVLVITAWINHARYEIAHLNPAWFIPVVGNVLVPIAGVHHAPPDLSWFFFAVGLLFWIVLLTIVMYRLIFHSPLPGRMVPTLFILLAPPSAGFISYVALTGGIDPFGRLLYFWAVFFFLLLLPQLGRFSRLPFTLSWWAYSFPLAAFTIATSQMAGLAGSRVYAAAGTGLYGLLVLVVGGLAIRTLAGVRRGEFCRPEQ